MIQKNTIVTKYNQTEIDKRYDFFLIKKDFSKKKPSARLLDEPVLEGKVLAVQYTSGNSFIVMLNKSKDNKAVIKGIISKYNAENDNDLSFEPISFPFDKQYEHSLLQLLFNSLASLPPNDGASNIGGKLLYFCRKSKKQIVCIELHISKNYVLSLNVKTFTMHTGIDNAKCYILQSNNTLRLKTDNEKDKNCYIKSEFKGTKNVVPFVETSDSEHFNKTKMGILTKIVKKFHKAYGNLVKLSFATESDWKKVVPDAAFPTKKRHLDLLKTVFAGKKIVIIDTIENNESKQLCQNIVNNLNNFFCGETNIEIKKRLSKNDFNIRIIHNKHYFEINEEEKDNHKVFDDRVVQHITIEDFSLKDTEELTANCLVVLNELLVKYDLLTTHKISLTKWSYEKDWTFCLDTDENESDEMKSFLFMRIKPDGCFEINTISKDLFNYNEYNIIDEYFKSGKKCRGLIINENGEMNIIQDTDLFMMPNFEKISSDISNEKSLSRSQQVVEDYFAGCIDIHYKEDNNVGYYSSGVISKGMNTKIENATHIRKITPSENSSLFFSKIIETMNVSFVRNGQLTVLPFPFKYLREFAKIAEAKN